LVEPVDLEQGDWLEHQYNWQQCRIQPGARWYYQPCGWQECLQIFWMFPRNTVTVLRLHMWMMWRSILFCNQTREEKYQSRSKALQQRQRQRFFLFVSFFVKAICSQFINKNRRKENVYRDLTTKVSMRGNVILLRIWHKPVLPVLSRIFIDSKRPLKIRTFMEHVMYCCRFSLIIEMRLGYINMYGNTTNSYQCY